MREADLREPPASTDAQEDEPATKAARGRRAVEAQPAKPQARAKPLRVRHDRRLPARAGAQPVLQAARARSRGPSRSQEPWPHARATACRLAARMNDDQLLRYSRHILLDELGIEGQRTAARRARAGDRRRRPGLAGGAVPRGGGVGRITLVDARPGRPDQPAAPDRAPRPTPSARRKVPRRAPARSHAINPDVEVVALAERVDAATARRAGRRGRRGARLQRQLRHPPRGQPRLRAPSAAAGVGRGDRLRRPGLGLRHAPRRRARATPACSRPRRRSRSCAARRWACSRRWSASSAACRRPRR